MNHMERIGLVKLIEQQAERIDDAPVVAWADYQAGWNGTVIDLNVSGRGKPLISKEDLI